MLLFVVIVAVKTNVITVGIDVDPRNRPLPTVPNQNTRKISEEDLDHGQDDYDYIQVSVLLPLGIHINITKLVGRTVTYGR